jgi:hypothetical protein
MQQANPAGGEIGADVGEKTLWLSVGIVSWGVIFETETVLTTLKANRLVAGATSPAVVSIWHAGARMLIRLSPVPSPL